MEELYFITGNKGKFKEAKEKLKYLDIELIQADMEYPEIQASDLKEIALFGINYCSESLKSPFFLEDSGLFIEELNSFPGPYSRYVHETIGNDGILKLLLNINNRGAYFKSTVGLYKDGPHIFEGVSRGTISHEIRGQGGFGYDPIFIPENNSKTFGEMTTVEKNKFSHRGKSLEKLGKYLENGVE
ncbi:MAG: Non-canonical purine NTP pyrophosphatase [Candidatus Methanofastidiosum methylothiophilum]|uniref:dITP/XTP pyrophosphatase n=1 Tax=Candidatus Methanofastidiosum methylothiophilum TaxID=1705564 RepID=A0A150IQ97_9EURY|nr:MAG: Non-canonical purine NTP pyrophosphatase [Candidatus Methanofastidiosum methylthiophilus]KYC46814.1 MAG: Non-canonical purine NTP pyrophosphatase [Candidatus Methanofastidiosum methylthiophilus]KYC49260.1 MAG: Non-canonical purine NTP pyrophosphatase [Candidatus Methanofastidiosum methylthiophilus]